MPDSLLIAGTIELLNGGTELTTGPGAGAVLRLGNSYKWGAPVIDNDAVASLLLDGERPYGERASNRTMTIPVEIFAPGRMKLMQAREQLLQLVDQQAWQLTYTPDQLPPLTWDCFRATIDVDKTGLTEEKQDYAHVDLTFQASPYGRSTDPEVVTISTAPALQIAPKMLDSFETAPGPSWATVTSPRVEGSRSAYCLGKATASRTFPPMDLSQMASVRVYASMEGVGNARQFTLTLQDSGGRTYSMGMHQRFLRGHEAWDRFDWPIAPPQGSFDLTHVIGYSLLVSGAVYLDELVAVPPALQGVTTPRGGVTQIPGVIGTARAPMNLQISKPDGTAFQQFLVHRPPQNVPELYTPIVPLDTTIVPDGTTQQPFPIIAGQSGGVRFNGTYVMLLAATTWNNPGDRTVTVTIRQSYNDSGVTGSDHATASFTQVMNPNNGPLQIINNSVSLPLIDGPQDNSASTYSVAITDTNTGDRFGELLILDTRGETIYVSSARSCTNFWIDEPNPLLDPYDFVGKVSGGSDRAHALSVAGEAQLPSRPLSLRPGDNQILLYCPQAPPQGVITYFPRWRTVRLA